MQKHTSDAESAPLRVVIVTLDDHLAGTVDGARRRIRRQLRNADIVLHAASHWAADPQALAACKADLAVANLIVVCMLFIEEHIEAIRPDLEARREHCDAMVCCLSAPHIASLTRMGTLDMRRSQGGGLSWLKKLRGNRGAGASTGSGAQQMAMLRRLPQLLRFIPGTAQDLRAYFLTMQYWLLGSETNIASMVTLLLSRYAAGPHRARAGRLKVQAPVQYPERGVYHPTLPERISEHAHSLPRRPDAVGTVGLIVMRSYLLAGNTDHYDGVITALEARNLNVVPVFASGLDAREAVEAYFFRNGVPDVDTVLSLTGFSLVGGPAYNDSAAAAELLGRLDVPYVSAQALEFQTLEAWDASARGLLPLEATMMVALPELDGAIGTMVFGGRSTVDGADPRRMASHDERTQLLADRIAAQVALRRSERAARRIAVVLFNFPPNGGSTGTAAHLAVFPSLLNTLRHLAAAGYAVELPDSVDDLRERILAGNASRFGTAANVHARMPVDDYARREVHLADIEAQWGPAPGRIQTDGRSLHVLGAAFGNVFVGIQPAFGYEGDPMRLLFERGFAPTHAFAAFYRYLREDFAAHAVLHFGTHGALEFMPGKQLGLSGHCWPERLLGALPNYYLYAANNPSEGLIAKRRSQATTITYLTPPVSEAGLYPALTALRSSLDRFRSLAPDDPERVTLAAFLQAQAAAAGLAELTPPWSDCDQSLQTLQAELETLEATLIPRGLHVVGEAPSRAARRDLLAAAAQSQSVELDPATLTRLLDAPAAVANRRAHDSIDAPLARLQRLATALCDNRELDAIVHALDGGYVAPVSGGDLLSNPEILPTGRNLHGFDALRIPSPFALAQGRSQAQALLERHMQDGRPMPETIALVLWGSDNLKNEGVAVAQALALIGAEPRMDSYGRLAGARLIPLAELGRPRIDVVMTLSGIFRDLLPKQIQLLAEAALLAARADEPVAQNAIRRHVLTYQQAHGCDLETAALRIFSNADGAYGANVNHLIDSGTWHDEAELGDMFLRRKSFAYGVDGHPTGQRALLDDMLGHVDLTFQNLDSIEIGVTTVDHYFDSLGGISRAVRQARGVAVPAFIGDATGHRSTIRTLADQVALEVRTRVLNPTWYEDMLKHGYEGVHQIETHITNTVGWSATTGQVEPWVYDELSRTFVLDETMRNRLADLNPAASVKVANRLLEAHERNYWSPDPGILDALRSAGEALEDRLEGVTQGAAA